MRTTKQRLAARDRLIALLESVTGTVAPPINRIETLLRVLIAQRDDARRELRAVRLQVRTRDAAIALLKRKLAEAQSFRGELASLGDKEAEE